MAIPRLIDKLDDPALDARDLCALARELARCAGIERLEVGTDTDNIPVLQVIRDSRPWPPAAEAGVPDPDLIGSTDSTAGFRRDIV